MEGGSWLFQNIGQTWMQWTGIVAVFFTFIGVMLAAMAIAQWRHPTVARRGALPLKTTRGDRLFIGLLSSAFIHLAWIGLLPAAWPLWIATIISVFWIAWCLAKG